MGAPRDRDPAGRARSARARDAAGRPLPRGADGVDRVPEDLALPPEQALAEAERLLAAGRPFGAHEVLEGTWKLVRGTAPAEAALWQGLAQLAVGLTHAQRGNAAGAAALLRRGADNVEPFAAAPPHGLPAGALVAWARALAAAVDGAGAGAAGPPRPPLTGG